MARKRKEQPPENTEGWMTTYCDLISLLLCFFIVMYAASSPDEAKWQWILQNVFTVSGEYVNPVAQDVPAPDPDDNTEGDSDVAPLVENDPEAVIPGIPGDQPMTFDDMFNWVAELVVSENLSDAVEVSQSPGRIHIRFTSDVMFAPDSYELTPAGMNTLNKIIPGFKAVNEYIKSVEVTGHTAQTDKVDITDWFISSLRAVSVTNYLDIQWHMVDHDKFLVEGKAGTDPYMPNDTEEGRAKNRRVELTIIRNDYKPEGTKAMSDILRYDYGFDPLIGSMDDGRKPTPGKFNQLTELEQAINEKYGLVDAVDTGANSGEDGPNINGKITITDDMLDPAKVEAAAEAAASDTGTPAPAATPAESAS